MPQVCEFYLIFVLGTNLHPLFAAVKISSGKYRTNTGPVLSSISCAGSKSHVSDCIFGSVGTLNCGHDKDAVISCLNGTHNLHSNCTCFITFSLIHYRASVL